MLFLSYKMLRICERGLKTAKFVSKHHYLLLKAIPHCCCCSSSESSESWDGGVQLFVLKALSEGQPKHNKNGRKKFKGSIKNAWNGAILVSVSVPRTTWLSPNRVVLSLFPPLARGARLDTLSLNNDWFDGYYALAGLDTLYWHIFGRNIKL